MVDKRVAFESKAGYDDKKSESREKVATFHFPLNNLEILKEERLDANL